MSPHAGRRQRVGAASGCGMGTVPECKTTSNAPGHRTAPGAPLGSQGTGLARASPRSYLQPEEVGETLEDTSTQAADAVVGEVPARQAEGPSGLGTPHCPRSTWAGPGRSWGGCTSTYRRFSSGRPRKAPGWTVLIRLFFRSLRGDRHRPDLRVCSRGPGTRPLPHPQETQHSRDRDMSAPRSPPSPHLPHTGSSVAPGAAKPHAGALLAAFHPISLLLSLQRVQGRREAPRRSRGGDGPFARSERAPWSMAGHAHTGGARRPLLHSCFRSSRIPAGYHLPHTG